VVSPEGDARHGLQVASGGRSAPPLGSTYIRQLTSPGEAPMAPAGYPRAAVSASDRSRVGLTTIAKSSSSTTHPPGAQCADMRPPAA
jgi:hypothetical protein